MSILRAICAAAALLVAAALPSAALAERAEDAAAALFDRIVAQPPRLRVFLQKMPKGGDLHNHLSGGTYAEDLLAWGSTGDFCASRDTLALVTGPCKPPQTEPLKDLGSRDPRLYSAMVDSLSTRGRAQGMGVNDVSGHDDFFDTFDRFWPVAARSVPRMFAAARESAAVNNVSYLELMSNPGAVHQSAMLSLGKAWNPDDLEGQMRQLEGSLPELVAAARAETDAWEGQTRSVLGCTGTETAGPCAVTLRYQTFGLRDQPPAYVFGQLALGFALAASDPRYVAVNIVAPEDGPVAVADFDLHMRMFRFFRERYPQVKRSIHGGELALGLVPPAVLRDHIRKSVEVAGADRIGHGIDIAHEDDAAGLLARMARDRIAVEVNITSNDTILGVRGAAHPISLYRAAGVPVVLSTDDEGVSRSDMTNEYLRAATEQGLRYADLKAMARASIEYAFLPGASLWNGSIGVRTPVCRSALPALASPAGPCGAFLAGSEKARAQWRLEREFVEFERTIVTLKF